MKRVLSTSVPLHPFLLALYPPLFLMSRNWEYFTVKEAVGTILVILSVVSLFWVVVGLGLKHNWKKSGLVVSLTVFPFFSYSYLYEILAGVRIAGLEPAHHRFLLPVIALIYCFGVWMISRVKLALDPITRVLNFFGAFLVLWTCTVMAGHIIGTLNVASFCGCLPSEQRALAGRLDPSAKIPSTCGYPDRMPDIYYIIVDGHARADILRKQYGYDNRPFLDFLVRKGFYIASRSNSNYCQTLLSLGSSLNLCYLDPQLERNFPGRASDSLLTPMIRHNRVAGFLKRLGYRSVAFSTGIGTSEIRTADYYLEPLLLPSFLQYHLFASSPIAPLIYAVEPDYRSEFHRRRLRYALNSLPEVALQTAPCFVFCHLICPHPPFVFGKNGEPRDDPRGEFFADGNRYHNMRSDLQQVYVRNYKNQLAFLEKKLTEAITLILANSDVRPIIVLQADHGPGSHLDWEAADQSDMGERMAILNAYLLPSSARKLLYDSITPVNTFRVIFNGCFGTDLDLLDDRSYFSLWEKPLRFIDVTEEIAVGSRRASPPRQQNQQ